jgi:CDGSH-type Zn-finger protein
MSDDGNVIKVHASGPYEVSGTVSIDGDALECPAWLCRCGQSGNKPYCDGSHKSSDFVDDGEHAGDAAAPDANASTELELTVRPDGPILIQGQTEIRSASDQTIAHASRGALCRCGQSAEKPFCDGAHKACGFTG